MTSRDTARERYAPPGAGPTDEDLRHEVELTRQELGDTVAELMYKMDVKSRTREAAQRRLAHMHDAARGAADHTRATIFTIRSHPALAAAITACAVALATLVLLRARR
jgi:hypothetical protein